jgi:hypothetical protein
MLTMLTQNPAFILGNPARPGTRAESPLCRCSAAVDIADCDALYQAMEGR